MGSVVGVDGSCASAAFQRRVGDMLGARRQFADPAAHWCLRRAIWLMLLPIPGGQPSLRGKLQP